MESIPAYIRPFRFTARQKGRFFPCSAAFCNSAQASILCLLVTIPFLQIWKNHSCFSIDLHNLSKYKTKIKCFVQELWIQTIIIIVFTSENKKYEGRGILFRSCSRSTATSPNFGPYPSAHSQLSDVVQKQ